MINKYSAAIFLAAASVIHPPETAQEVARCKTLSDWLLRYHPEERGHDQTLESGEDKLSCGKPESPNESFGL